MMQIDKLTLITGVDIPLPELQVNIHQPTIREIAYIGEKGFYEAASALVITTEKFISNQENLTEEDKNEILQLSDFELFLKILDLQPLLRVYVNMLLTIMMPMYTANFQERFIFLNSAELENSIVIDSNNFSMLQEVVKKIFCLEGVQASDEFNPDGDAARDIVEKIKRGRARVAAEKGTSQGSGGILSKYISGLGIGTHALNILNVLDLTLYQLFDQIERYQLYTSFDIGIRAKLAGADKVEDVDWLKDIEK